MLVYSRAFLVRILERQGFPTPLESGWQLRALAPETTSPAETRSGPRRDDLPLQTPCGCGAFGESASANLRTVENRAGSRALHLRSNPAGALAPPETSSETGLPRAEAWAVVWRGHALAAHRR